MTIPSTERRAGPFTGTGALVSYPFAFRVIEAADVAVVTADTDDVETEGVLDSTFLVTLNVDQDTTPGGSVQYAVGGVATALPSGYTLAIYGATPYTQEADLPQGGNFNARTVEDALDRLCMQIQQLKDVFSRSVQVTVLAPQDTDVTLPIPSAGAIIGWNDDGTALQNYTPNSVDLSVATLTADLASTTNANKAAGQLGFDPTLNYVAQTVGVSLKSEYDLTWFDGVAGDWNGTTGTDDTAGIQAAINFLPEGSTVTTSKPLKLTDWITVNTPLTIRSRAPGSVYNTAVRPGFYQTDSTKGVFKLVARTANYAFGAYGIVGVHFDGVFAQGPAIASRAAAFVATDTTVNAGDYHIRECSFTRCAVRYFVAGIDLTGIAYLNNFYNNSIAWCDTGVKFARGAASDAGGQNRFFGGAIVLCGTGISYFEDTVGGDLGLHGLTVSECTGYAVKVNEETAFYSSPDCQFEANATGGLYFPIADNSNPASDAPKYIQGKFLNNGAAGAGPDIYVNKTSTGFAGGDFHWPMRIDNAYLGSTVGLKVDVPGGHSPMRSPAFVIGLNVAGLLGSKINPTQISSNFAGTWERRGLVTETYGTTVAIESYLGDSFSITATNGTAFAISAPEYPTYGQLISITLKNTSGGALGAITWNAVFKMASWTSPATGFSRTIWFRYDGANWIEMSRTTADIPN